jgi:hypothetical protein
LGAFGGWGVGGWPPTEGRAGDESFGHDSPPAHLTLKKPKTIYSAIRFLLYYVLVLVFFECSGVRGGGKCPDEERST